uniref:Uncharacterized protein n=1 Tax=Meloidogyne hapla TaxID=6305 RepID=A0A1I8AWT2_MELHA
MSNESSISINQNDDKILKEFSSKFISTISALSDDYKSGGSKKGWLLSDAVKQFDKDWHHNYSYYMEKLECENPLQLAEKLGSRVRVFLDGYNGWRVAPMKTLKNINVLNQIDSDIEKRKKRVRFADAPTCTEEISVLCEKMRRLAITKELLTFYDENNMEE